MLTCNVGLYYSFVPNGKSVFRRARRISNSWDISCKAYVNVSNVIYIHGKLFSSDLMHSENVLPLTL